MIELTGTSWDGGSKDDYQTFSITTGNKGSLYISENPERNLPVCLGKGIVLVQTGVFCGKPATMVVYIRKSDCPLLVGVTTLPELTDDAPIGIYGDMMLEAGMPEFNLFSKLFLENS